MKTLMLALILFVSAGSNAFAFDAPELDQKVWVVLTMENGDDQAVLTTIYTSLMAAEKVAKALNVELVAESEIKDDMFVFFIKI